MLLICGGCDHRFTVVVNSFVTDPPGKAITTEASRQRRHGQNVILSEQLVPPSRWCALKKKTNKRQQSSTALNLLLDVPDYFFTFTFPMLGILLSLSKNFGRVRMEERAWEQRLEESRAERLRRDPTVTELDLRRQEAAQEWSAYGKPRMQEEQEELARRQRQQQQQRRYDEESDEEFYRSRKGRRGRRRVAVMDREDDDEEDLEMEREPSVRMTEEEIEAFEMEYGVEYDPYYDDPYTEEELPEDVSYNVDKVYGDRIYESGEVFYKDAETGLFYRQGAKPRNLRFWGS